jgi:hypothetical protein
MTEEERALEALKLLGENTLPCLCGKLHILDDDDLLREVCECGRDIFLGKYRGPELWVFTKDGKEHYERINGKWERAEWGE